MWISALIATSDDTVMEIGSAMGHLLFNSVPPAIELPGFINVDRARRSQYVRALRFPMAPHAPIGPRRTVFRGPLHRRWGKNIAVHIPLRRAMAQSFLGDRVGAQRSVKEGLRLAEQQPQLGVLCWAFFWASFRCLIERDFEQAGSFADRTAALAAGRGVGISR